MRFSFTSALNKVNHWPTNMKFMLFGKFLTDSNSGLVLFHVNHFFLIIKKKNCLVMLFDTQPNTEI